MKVIDRIFTKQEIFHYVSVDRDNWRWDSTTNKLETTDTSHWLKNNESLYVDTETGKVKRRYK